jgi:hypothetical protein
MRLGVLPLVLSFLAAVALFYLLQLFWINIFDFCFFKDLCLRVAGRRQFETIIISRSFAACVRTIPTRNAKISGWDLESVYQDPITENEGKMKCTSLLCLVVAGLASSRAVASSDGDAIRAGEHFRMAFLAPRQTVPVRNLQVFTGSLGGVRASAITNTGDPQRQFGVDGDTFVRLLPWLFIWYCSDDEAIR